MLNHIHSVHHIQTINFNNTPFKLYIKEHFNKAELNAFPIKQVRQLPQRFLDMPFTEVSSLDLNKLPKSSKEYDDSRSYLRALAFFQRYRFSLDYINNTEILMTGYKDLIKEMPNFQLLDVLFNKYYPEYFKHRGDDQKLYKRDEQKLKLLVFRLWLGGYGLINGLGHEPITNDVLKRALRKDLEGTNHHTYSVVAQFLSYILMNEKDSPVTKLFTVTKEIPSAYEIEKKLWQKLLEDYTSDLNVEIKKFVLDFLYKTTQKSFVHTYTEVDGKITREVYEKMTISTWANHSRALRTICEYSYEFSCHSVNDVLQGRLFDVFIALTEDYAKRTLERFTTSIKGWFNYHKKEQRLTVNDLRILPTQRLGRNTTRYGRLIDFRQATKLIETLLDDQSPHHNDNELVHYRSRRICLLQLETGKRIHELTLLKKDCLVTNKYNDVYINFHKTKNGKPSRIKLSEEGQKWVAQLAAISSPVTIKINTETYLYGDDLDIYRLVANASNTSPYNRGTANWYLKELQQKIFGGTPPSGRFFSTHDLRRMCATYMKIKGYSDVDIAERLGQESLQSQIVYTLTIPPERLEKLKKAAQKGLYNNLNGTKKYSISPDHNYDSLDTETVLRHTSMIIDTSKDEDIAKMFAEKLSKELEGLELPSNSYISDGEVPSGFPMRTHNCKAQAKATCFHHSLKCYKCQKYSPDQDKLLEHKSELARWIVFLHHNSTLLKKTKNKLEKNVLPAKIDDIETDLKEAFKELFVKFKLDVHEAKNIEKEVQSIAKKYIKKYYKTFPSPTVEQMDMFMKSGVVNG